jgi:hypothetical protein
MLSLLILSTTQAINYGERNQAITPVGIERECQLVMMLSRSREIQRLQVVNQLRFFTHFAETILTAVCLRDRRHLQFITRLRQSAGA